ncbi:unnamed protein product [Oreochromis niloticus]|nr:unnamed protein product [Mustela putorius furo]
MAAGTALLCCTLLFVLVFVPAEPKIITAESGQNMTLTCRAPNISITGVKWIRADLWPKNVLLYRDSHFIPDNQHPSFKNRVDLQERQMKDGDVSLILKDVTIADTGTYMCRVIIEERQSLKLSIIHLIVDPDQKIITAVPGQDVTLTCRAPNSEIRVVEWSRADLGDKYVLLHWDGHFVPDNQHLSFKNRMDLQDRQMKDGDVSLILKDVTIDDAGTYECRVYMGRETDSWEFISIIFLRVPPDKHTIFLLSVLLPIGSVYVVVLLVRRCVHRKLEEDGEDDITSDITYSVVKSSNHQQPRIGDRETDSAVIYSAVRSEDVSYGQTTIRTRRPSFPGPL